MISGRVAMEVYMRLVMASLYGMVFIYTASTGPEGLLFLE